jgi:hypothetical protein
MVFFEHTFGESTAERIENHVRSLRFSAPPGSRENISFRSTNANNVWWRNNPVAHSRLTEVANILMQPLSAANKNQVFSTFMLVRNVRSIIQPGQNGRSYINRQGLHVNFETSPTHGEAFMQIIYYIDTPRYANGRIANSGNRGQLLVSHGRNTRRFDPIRGHAVYFTPSDTWHEVLPQTNSNQNVNVDRKMIIMMLYKRTNRTNVVAQQIRGYHNRFPLGLRAVAGHVARPTRVLPNRTVNTLSNILSRTTLQSPSKKRKRPATAGNKNPRPIKFYKD